jgi:sugar phosphate isomerase/epimerase
MQLSLSGWSFPHCTLEEAAGIARALGFTAADWGAFPGGQLDREAILHHPQGEVRRLLSSGLATGNIFWTFGTGSVGRSLNSPDMAVRATNRDDFKRVVAFCHAAGVPSLMTLPGTLHPGQSHAEAVETCIDACSELVEMSRPAGVQLVIEPHVMSILESPAAVLEVVQRVPGLRLVVDYSHFATLGFTAAEIDPLCHYAGHVHLRQAKPGALQTRLEHGTINFPALLNTLRAAGYDGYLAVEYVHQDYLQTDNVDVISETVKMRDLIRQHLP